MAAFRPRKKQIAVLELLWVILALIVWAETLKNAYMIIFDDNSSAEHGLFRGMSNQTDVNALLAIFWFERVASKDNPADCLTMPWLPHGHLDGAINISRMVDWEPLFMELGTLLRAEHLPRWLDIIRRLASAFRLSDMYMKDMERGLSLSYLSPRVFPSSSRNYFQEVIDIFSVSKVLSFGMPFQLFCHRFVSDVGSQNQYNINEKSVENGLPMRVLFRLRF